MLHKKTLAEVAQNFRTSEASILEDVNNLKKWLDAQPHLPKILGQQAILNFFILSKLSTEKTKQKIDMYYTLRSVMPDIFGNINLKGPNIAQFKKIQYIVPLPKVTPEGYRVLVVKMRDKSLSDMMEPQDALATGINLNELRLREDLILGDIAIFDLDGISLGYIAKLTPSFILKMSTIYTEIFSSPLKACLMLNSPPFLKSFLNVCKGLMKPKLFERIHVCPDVSILHERLPKEIIPADYGGEEVCLEELQKTLDSVYAKYEATFDQLDVARVDEDLRPAPLKNDEILGFYGNFKKLNVD